MYTLVYIYIYKIIILRRIASVGFVVKKISVNYLVSECHKLAQNEYKTRCDWLEKNEQLGTVQKTKIWPYY